jgi:hypothetical protein
MNAIITSLFHNIELDNSFRDSWRNSFKDYAESHNSDFIDFEELRTNEITESYKKYFLNVEEDKKEEKTYQFAKLEFIDSAFSNGYEWVMWMDGDIAINKETKNPFENLNKDVIYFNGAISKPEKNRFSKGARALINCVNEKFPIKDLKYGNSGTLTIHKDNWKKIKKQILNSSNIISFVENQTDFFRFPEQGVLSIALMLEKIELLIFQHKRDVLHLCGVNKKRYLDYTGLDEKITKDYALLKGRKFWWIPILEDSLERLNSNKNLIREINDYDWSKK